MTMYGGQVLHFFVVWILDFSLTLSIPMVCIPMWDYEKLANRALKFTFSEKATKIDKIFTVWQYVVTVKLITFYLVKIIGRSYEFILSLIFQISANATTARSRSQLRGAFKVIKVEIPSKILDAIAFRYCVKGLLLAMSILRERKTQNR